MISIKQRENKKVDNIILTHWHTDHTQGIRVVEQINFNQIKECAEEKLINVYIAEHQLETFKKFGCVNMLIYYEQKGIIKIIYLKHKQKNEFAHTIIMPYYIEKIKGYYFLIENKINGKREVYELC